MSFLPQHLRVQPVQGTLDRLLQTHLGEDRRHSAWLKAHCELSFSPNRKLRTLAASVTALLASDPMNFQWLMAQLHQTLHQHDHGQRIELAVAQQRLFNALALR